MRILASLMLVLIPLLGEKRSSPQVVTPPELALRGIDVSHYQHRIAWDTVAASQSVDFAFVKATEGHEYRDSLFCRNWESLQRHGIKRGAYHFFRAYGCGYDQARNFLNAVEFVPGDFAPVLDIERADGIAPEIVRQEVKIWLEEVERTLSVKPIIYSSQNFYDFFLAGHFDNYPLWIARYSADVPTLINGKNWDIWQYSCTGTICGIPKPVDLNFFPGNTALLERLCWYPRAASAEPRKEAESITLP